MPSDNVALQLIRENYKLKLNRSEKIYVAKKQPRVLGLMYDILPVIKVLHVEDSRSEAIMTDEKIARVDDGRMNIRSTTRLATALEILSREKFDALILDLCLPDSDGFESLSVLNQKHPALPIIVLSGMTDELAVLKYLQIGAQEFLLKGECSGQMIRQAIFNAMFRKSLRKNIAANDSGTSKTVTE